MTVVEGSFTKMYGESQAAKQSLRQAIRDEGAKGFPDVVASSNVSEGICHLYVISKKILMVFFARHVADCDIFGV